MSDIGMDYRQPAATLAEHVSFFYQVRQTAGSFSAVDRADYAQLRFILAGENGHYQFVDGTVQAMPTIYIQGPTTGNTTISGSAPIDVVGAGLMPAGWAALVPMDASAAANRLFDAVHLLGPAVVEARAALIAHPDFDTRVAIVTDLFERLMARASPDFHAFVHQVNAWLADSVTPQIGDLLSATGLSLSQVERRCKRYFGSPPKMLARKYRALKAAVAMTHHDTNLDQILADGFYDQSHLIREMKHFTGMTPTAFAAQPTVFNQQIAKRIELERSNPIERKSLIT
ncbi:AraC family transcriptional regulator [Novosphingobium sp.]|uniref:helix-turn-helix domain-containing protein n=1 Tax=Novosphingobium sp. TaxID=1874826 RepID=UPI00334215FB